MAVTKLVPHRAYFFCGYYTDTESVPSIETYIYLGPVAEVLGGPPREKLEHIFQEPECYFQQQRGELSPAASPTDRGLVLIAEDLMEPMVQDYEGLFEFLERCKRDAT